MLHALRAVQSSVSAGGPAGVNEASSVQARSSRSSYVPLTVPDQARSRCRPRPSASAAGTKRQRCRRVAESWDLQRSHVFWRSADRSQQARKMPSVSSAQTRRNRGGQVPSSPSHGSPGRRATPSRRGPRAAAQSPRRRASRCGQHAALVVRGGRHAAACSQLTCPPAGGDDRACPTQAFSVPSGSLRLMPSCAVGQQAAEPSQDCLNLAGGTAKRAVAPMLTPEPPVRLASEAWLRQVHTRTGKNGRAPSEAGSQSRTRSRKSSPGRLGYVRRSAPPTRWSSMQLCGRSRDELDHHSCRGAENVRLICFRSP